jgi:hypothetical protein
MAELDFEIKGKHGEIAASTFERAVAHAVALLREFDSAISGQPRGTLRWYIAGLHSNGNLLVSFQSKVKPTPRKRERTADVSMAVANSFLTGFYDLETKCETPPYLSEFGLQRAEELTSLIGKNGATAFRFVSSNRTVDVTSKTLENIGKLLPIRRTAIGSVEGKLEAINLHKRPRVLVYHAISKKAVTCEFDPEKFMNQAKDYLGRMVTVFGTLHKNINGDTLRVAVDRLCLSDDLRADLSAKAPIEAEAEPEFANAPSTAEYIRRIRGGR